MVNKRFLYYKKLDTFKNDLNEGIIDRESIGFIEDANLIWTHGVYFGSKFKDSDWTFGQSFPITFKLDDSVNTKEIQAEINDIKTRVSALERTIGVQNI